ncbi:claudin-15-like [Brienomyrus brachyistius]|uniref:claudin-15-like n=1 Tax=Brienomyrus brachyistius TaxID=42636 RepID=UPI0020B1A0CD|nr:claudin-15-like [Brienomyrus brachyistius]
MSTGLEVTGFMLGAASWLLTGVALANDYWKVSTYSGSVIVSNRQYENLWHSCAEDSSGVSNCRDFQSMLSLPGYLQACRALMIIALVLGLISVFISMMGLKCIKIGTASDQTKSKVASTGGVMFILSGLSSITAASWYASRVVQEFYNPLYGGIKFELGVGLYMAWAGACLAILGGAFLCCSCREGMKGSGKAKYYAKSGQGQNIYRGAATSETGTAKAFV